MLEEAPYHKHTGLDGPKIDYNDLENKPSGLVAMGSGTVPATGNDLAITGLGFKPKLVKITAVRTMADYTGGVSASSVGTYDGTNYSCVYVFHNGTTVGSNTYNTKMIYIYDGSSATHATIKSLDADGFTLNCGNNSIASDFIYEAYG